MFFEQIKEEMDDFDMYGLFFEEGSQATVVHIIFEVLADVWYSLFEMLVKFFQDSIHESLETGW